MWDVRDVECWGCEMLGILNAGDVGCSRFRIFRIRNTVNVGCWGCGIL